MTSRLERWQMVQSAVEYNAAVVAAAAAAADDDDVCVCVITVRDEVICD